MSLSLPRARGSQSVFADADVPSSSHRDQAGIDLASPSLLTRYGSQHPSCLEITRSVLLTSLFCLFSPLMRRAYHSGRLPGPSLSNHLGLPFAPTRLPLIRQHRRHQSDAQAASARDGRCRHLQGWRMWAGLPVPELHGLLCCPSSPFLSALTVPVCSLVVLLLFERYVTSGPAR